VKTKKQVQTNTNITAQDMAEQAARIIYTEATEFWLFQVRDKYLALQVIQQQLGEVHRLKADLESKEHAAITEFDTARGKLIAAVIQ
jgi:hypothetical protein